MKKVINSTLSWTDKILADLAAENKDAASLLSMALNYKQVESFQNHIGSTVFLCSATLLDMANKDGLDSELQFGFKFGSLALLNAVPEIVGRIENGDPEDSGKVSYIAGFKQIFHHDIIKLEYIRENPHGADKLAKLMYATLRCNIAHKSILSNVFVLDKYPENLRFDREMNKINIETGVWFKRNLAYVIALMGNMKKTAGLDTERWINLQKLQYDENENSIRILSEFANWYKKNT